VIYKIKTDTTSSRVWDRKLLETIVQVVLLAIALCWPVRMHVVDVAVAAYLISVVVDWKPAI
jgi:hypothetical protein